MIAASAWALIERTVSKCRADRISRLSASLAFYTTFAAAPLLVIAVAVGSIIFGREKADQQITAQVRRQVGRLVADAIDGVVRTTSDRASHGYLATGISIVVLLYAATNVFIELQDAMNQIWEVKPAPRRFWWQIIKDRLLSFVMVLAVGMLLLVSFLLSAALALLSHGVGAHLSWVTRTAPISFVIYTLLVATIYKVLPDATITWSDVWLGAAGTAAMLTLGRFLLGLYFKHSAVTSAYGAAGSVAVLLLWVYYSAQILYAGAEFTRVFAHHSGTPIKSDA